MDEGLYYKMKPKCNNNNTEDNRNQLYFKQHNKVYRTSTLI